MKRTSDNITDYETNTKCIKNAPLLCIHNQKSLKEICTKPIIELTRIQIDYFYINKDILDLSLLNNLITNPNVIFDSIINITSNKLSSNNLIYLAEIIKKNTVKILGFNNSYIENIDIIAESLKNNTSINQIYIYNCNINKIGSLCDVLKNNTSVSFLNISHNKIEDVDKIAELIKENKSIKDLIINDNHFTNINSIGDALKDNSCIENLDIFDCLTNLDSVKYFLNSLQYNHSIKKINLYKINTINFNILEPLQYNDSLQYIEFTKYLTVNPNGYHKIINSEILAKIISNKNILHLDLSNCIIRDNLYPLVNILIEKDNIKYLYLQNCGCDITTLSSYITKTNKLTSLYIDYNFISNNKLFTEAIKSNKSLLILSMNYIKGIANNSMPFDFDINYFLQNAILNNENCKLTDLRIQDMITSEKTINILSDIISTKKTFKFLNIKGDIWNHELVKVGKINLWPLIDAIKSNDTLTEISINRIYEETNNEQLNNLYKVIDYILDRNRI